MSRMIDKWHELYHNGTTVDLINCPHCQDEFIAWEGWPVLNDDEPIDRLEDLRI